MHMYLINIIVFSERVIAGCVSYYYMAQHHVHVVIVKKNFTSYVKCNYNFDIKGNSNS